MRPYRKPQYDVEELRRLADSEEKGENENGRSPNYKCPHCGNKQYIDDYQSSTPLWCKVCDKIRQFRKL